MNAEGREGALGRNEITLNEGIPKGETSFPLWKHRQVRYKVVYHKFPQTKITVEIHAQSWYDCVVK